MFRRANDRLLDIERGVQQKGNSGDFLELVNQAPISGIGALGYCLGTRSVVYVDDSRDSVLPSVVYRKNEEHVGRTFGVADNWRCIFLQHRGGEGPEGLPQLDFFVDDF